MHDDEWPRRIGTRRAQRRTRLAHDVVAEADGLTTRMSAAVVERREQMLPDIGSGRDGGGDDHARTRPVQSANEVRVARAEPADDALGGRQLRAAIAGEQRVEAQRLEV